VCHWHGNPNSVSGTLLEAWANEPPGMVPGGSFFYLTSQFISDPAIEAIFLVPSAFGKPVCLHHVPQINHKTLYELKKITGRFATRMNDSKSSKWPLSMPND
jgi:hypothetical protein